ncbi:hypothetical protein ACLEQD_18480, partial [Corallococcus sp. 4LFB]
GVGVGGHLRERSRPPIARGVPMAQAHETDTEKQARHARRHEAHVRATYAAFLRHLCELSALPPRSRSPPPCRC